MRPKSYPENYFEDTAAGLRPFAEFLWFGIDSKGQIACFTPIGVGLIPSIVFHSRENYFSMLEAMEQLPGGRGHESMARDVKSMGWWEWADRGIYAYDWDDGTMRFADHMPYELRARPILPIHVDDLPAPINSVLTQVTFKGIEFGKDIYVRKHFSDFNE